MKTHLAALVLTCTWATWSMAAPLNTKQVPADAKWIVHVDVDAMRESGLVRMAYERGLERIDAIERHAEQFCLMLGINPEDDLHSLTLYGKQFDHEQIVLIVDADLNQALLAQKVKSAPGYTSQQHGDYELHSWGGGAGAATGAFYKPNVMLLARTPADVAAALDTLQGQSPSLAGAASVLAAPVPSGTMLVGRGVGLSAVPLPYKSPLVKQADSLSLVIGEAHNQVFLNVDFCVQSPDVAQKFKTVIEGALAAVELHHRPDSPLTKGAQILAIGQTGQTVTIRGEAGVNDVWREMQILWKAISAKYLK